MLRPTVAPDASEGGAGSPIVVLLAAALYTDPAELVFIKCAYADLADLRVGGLVTVGLSAKCRLRELAMHMALACSRAPWEVQRGTHEV